MMEFKEVALQLEELGLPKEELLAAQIRAFSWRTEM